MALRRFRRAPLSEHGVVVKLVVGWLVRVAAVLLSAGPLAAQAQPAANIPRLCFVTFDPGTLQSNRYGVFFQALRELGYVAGQTISIDYLSAEGRAERFPPLAAQCVRLKADIIVASTTPGALAAKNATGTIPIVFIGTGDPVGVGLVESLARPGRNVTGMSGMAPGLSAKRLELLKEAVPRISRVLELSYRGAAEEDPPAVLPHVRSRYAAVDQIYPVLPRPT